MNQGTTTCFLTVLSLSVGFAVFANGIPITGAQYRPGKAGEQLTSTLSTVLNGYDKRVRPNFGVQPVDISVTMYILSFESVCSKGMETTFTFYFRQRWRDPRLKFNGQDSIAVPGNELSDKLWLPDTFFVNQKGSISNDQDSFVKISPEGEVLRSVKLTVTANCPMDFRNFPMDTQLCSLEIESFSSNMNDIRYNWGQGTNSVGVSDTASLPAWKLLGYKAVSMEISLSTGNYTRLAVNLQFTRSFGYYIISVYVPATFLVVLAWIPFWINNDAMTSRVLTSVASVLCLLHLWQISVSSLAKVSYFKCLDVYFASCIGMAFLSLFESALMTFLIMRRKQYKKALQNDITRTVSVVRRKPCCLNLAPWLLDWFSRLVYPALFIGFNFMYWKIHLNLSNTDLKLSDIIILNPNEVS